MRWLRFNLSDCLLDDMHRDTQPGNRYPSWVFSTPNCHMSQLSVYASSRSSVEVSRSLKKGVVLTRLVHIHLWPMHMAEAQKGAA
jgi:hypothetical protein